MPAGQRALEDEAIQEKAEDLYRLLQQAGIEVLYDDRPGVICLSYSWMSDALKMLPLPVDQRVCAVNQLHSGTTFDLFWRLSSAWSRNTRAISVSMMRSAYRDRPIALTKRYRT